MKKNLNFRFFSTINLRGIISNISLIVIICTFSFSSWFFIQNNINSSLVSLAVSIGTKKPIHPPSNIAQTMLHISLPGASVFTKEPTLVTPVPTPEVSPPATFSALTPLTHVTYEDGEYKSSHGIEINNQSNKKVDIDALLNKELSLSLDQNPSVLIIHTHTTESYTPSPAYNYTPTESYRTLDPKYNMIAVGEVIYNKLTEKGINVIHDKTINDYPSYSSSYSKSLKVINSYMEKYPSIKFVIDVHRDASSEKKGVVTQFDQNSSKVMLVIGTNGSGLSHPAWENNLSFALKLQHKMNSLFPTLARSINLRKERFNQHTAPYAFILEVGTNSNTLDEAKTAAGYFSSAFLSLFKL